MRNHGTEAISADGKVAFTLNGDFLAECVPDACDQVGLTDPELH
jgi:hypothetical protein